MSGTVKAKHQRQGLFMQRIGRSISLAAVLAILPVAVAVGAAEAAPASGAPASGPLRARTVPSEPTGRPASPAAMSSGRIGCGEVITRSTTLTTDVGPCPGNGIIIGADNITLNLNGHVVAGLPGPGSGNDAGIRLPKRVGVRITGHPGQSGKAGTITAFDAGVVVNGGSGNTIENLEVRDNIGSPVPAVDDEAYYAPPAAELGDGIILFKSASNRIVNNIVTNNGLYDGIGVFGLGSDFNTVEGNTVQGTVGLFFNRSASGSGIIVNHFLDQRPGDGLVISGNKVRGNTVRANTGSGISNIGHVDGEAVGNVVEENGLWALPFATEVEPPVAEDVAANGIGVVAGVGQVGGPDSRMLVKDNVVTHNGLSGLFIRGDANVVETNRVFRNGAFGIYVTGSETRISYNTTGYNYILDLYDFFGDLIEVGTIGVDPALGVHDGCPNIWFGNTWGPVQPGGLGLYRPSENAYRPDCTTIGGSGPKSPAA